MANHRLFAQTSSQAESDRERAVMRNLQLDFLRAGSIMLVLFAHLGFQNVIPGGLGVTIFFGISGYIITNLLIKEQSKFGDVKISLFLRRRFWKIFPPFFFLVVIPSLLFWKVYSISIEKFMAQVLFVFNWFQIFGEARRIFPPSGVVWSLSIEEQFYISIAAFISIFQLLSRKENRFIKLMYILISTTWIVSTFSRIIIAGQDDASMDYGDTGNLLRIYAGTDTRISSICIGAFVALLTREGAKPNKLIQVITKYPITALIVSQTLLVMSLLIRDQFFRDTLRYSIQEAAIFLAITTGPVINSWPTFLQFISRMRLVKIIATASYSIYLSHTIVLYALDSLYIQLSPDVNKYIWKAFCAIACLIVGLLAHELFDSPFRYKRELARRQN